MPSFKKPGPSADFEKVKGDHYLKEILILNSFSFENNDSRFARLKSGLALRLLSKGLFYIRAMGQTLIVLSEILFFSSAKSAFILCC